ncbi:NAD(P)H-dependent oxidoreductase [Luteolibacter ambystomatis]|uniref:NAD(P)H-dependent oxidoreductase n=1 Tax=Luteolibacter ambystomatis TaxID=2824561 RepID=A0A975G8G1_9BACT|nr:NAD(P)H-dependent oxidoreductase [Luteolibacter ambystomatis]QUE50737.1 NAD(P)H-dependent oxidoreductase [Luteolibacter ambystomatis]
MKLLILPGSIRKESYNLKLAALAAEHARQAGVEVDLVAPDDLRPIPLYNGDLEEAEGLPTAVKTLKQRFIAAQAIVLACPEYNSSITPLLKNTLDWVSRAETDDEPSLAAYQGKVAGLLSASPGGFGGMRGLVTVRSMLGNIGVIVVPTQLAIPKAYEAFDDQGALKEARQQKSLAGVVDEVIRVAKALAIKS